MLSGEGLIVVVNRYSVDFRSFRAHAQPVVRVLFDWRLNLVTQFVTSVLILQFLSA